MAEAQHKLIRKHYLLSRENIEKVDRLAEAESCSAAEVVCKAIEAYESGQDEEGLEVLLNAVENSIAEAAKATRATNRKISQVLKRLGACRI